MVSSLVSMTWACVSRAGVVCPAWQPRTQLDWMVTQYSAGAAIPLLDLAKIVTKPCPNTPPDNQGVVIV
jgi:hypothetical protein